MLVTDHSPRLTVARGLSPERLARQLDVVDAVNAHLAGGGFTLLKGIEVDILDDGGLDQTEEMLGRLDVVALPIPSSSWSVPSAQRRSSSSGLRRSRVFTAPRNALTL